MSLADETPERPDVPEPESPDMLDLVGIGFGPANLALAIALEEHNAAGAPGDRLRAAFLEKQSRFGWHRGMLIDDATMQVSFLKDLVTMRNPASDFSFVSYLHERGRLVDFVNFKTLYPLRVEFHDYLEWAAERMAPLVTYGRQVTDVRPVLAEGGAEGPVIRAFDVVAAEVGPDGPTGATTVQRARNVVVALGLEPNVPPGARLGPRVWHNLDLLSRVDALAAAPRPPRCLVVVGAGQSAAEAVEFLHRRFPTAQVCSVFARYGYTPADDTPFANRIFDPGAVDTYFDADAGVKRMLFDYHRNTNYSVVDQELIEELYRRMYQERVQGEPRLRMLNASRVTRVDEVEDAGGGGRVDVTVEHLPTGEEATLAADALVYATGYRPRDALGLLGQAGELCARDDEGLARVERDYRVVTTLPSEGAVYLQGGTEHAHGITSTLLSNVAVRAGEIVASLVGKGYSAPSSSPVPAAPTPTPTPVASGSPASRPLTAASAVAARTASS